MIKTKSTPEINPMIQNEIDRLTDSILKPISYNWLTNTEKIKRLKYSDRLARFLIQNKVPQKIIDQTFNHLLKTAFQGNDGYLIRDLLVKDFFTPNKDLIRDIFFEGGRYLYIETIVTVYDPRTFDYAVNENEDNRKLRLRVGKTCIRVSKIFWGIYFASKVHVGSGPAMFTSKLVVSFLFGGSKFIPLKGEILTQKGKQLKKAIAAYL